MKVTRFPAAMALAVAGILSVGGSGCGDSFVASEFPRIDLQVEDSGASNGSVYTFPDDLTTSATKQVEVRNIGDGNLEIESIDWDVDADGVQIKNKYVELDFLSAISGFPVDIAGEGVDNLVFNVTFNPAGVFPLDDTSPSVLVIKTNAKDDNLNPVGDIRVNFVIGNDQADPRLNPSNSFQFTNATTARPVRQDIRVENNGKREFRVLDVRLLIDNDEFRIINAPSSGTLVLGNTDSQYVPAVFAVEYAPADVGEDFNTLIVETDAPGFAQLRLDLTTITQVSEVTVSYEFPDEKLDFTNTTSTTTRSVLVTNNGSTSIGIQEPRIEPGEARLDFSFEAFSPSADGGAETPINGWPRGVPAGRSVRLAVTFSPAAANTANGTLTIPYTNPTPNTIVLDLFSGTPKSRLVMGPSTGSIAANGDVEASDSGTRNVVIYNEGNGTLDIMDVTISGQFTTEPLVYSLPLGFTASDVAPNGLLAIPIDYNLRGLASATSDTQDTLRITYFNDFTGGTVEQTFGLLAAGIGATATPTADPGDAADYAGATVGQAVVLSGAGSDGAGETIAQNAHVWYLTAKPVGSTAKFNLQGGTAESFVPDMAGSYTVELFVYIQSADEFIYSDAASVTFTVSE